MPNRSIERFNPCLRVFSVDAPVSPAGRVYDQVLQCQQMGKLVHCIEENVQCVGTFDQAVTYGNKVNSLSVKSCLAKPIGPISYGSVLVDYSLNGVP